MTHVRELRATAAAALQAWQSAQRDPTMTNAELKRVKRTADHAHNRWIEAATDTLTGGSYAVPGE